MSEGLGDSFGRWHHNLRISVTDRCNMRCTYCMPEEMEFLPRDHLLTFEEITRFVRIAAGLGIRKLRLTGGEPLLRKDLYKLVGMLVAIEGIADIGLTTNGVLLARQAQALYDAGLRRINISLDTLDAAQFKALTRRDLFTQVLAGIEAARSVGFAPIKLNAVAIAGVTEGQLARLAAFARDRGLELRFIEFMPLEADRVWDHSKVLTADQILGLLAKVGLPVVPVTRREPRAPADEYVYADGKGSLGIIASVTKPFCESCNRIRLTAEGKLRNCLFALEEEDIKGPLRRGDSDEQIAELIRKNVANKWEGHQINSSHFVRPKRTMHRIGG